MHRTQFTFYESFSRALRRIRKKSDRADAYDAICDYALYGIEPDLETLPPPVAIAFDLIRPNLDTARRLAAAGQRGGQALGKPGASKNKKEKENKNKIKFEYESEEDLFPTTGEIVRAMMERGRGDQL